MPPRSSTEPYGFPPRGSGSGSAVTASRFRPSRSERLFHLGEALGRLLTEGVEPPGQVLRAPGLLVGEDGDTEREEGDEERELCHGRHHIAQVGSTGSRTGPRGCPRRLREKGGPWERGGRPGPRAPSRASRGGEGRGRRRGGRGGVVSSGGGGRRGGPRRP